MGLAFLGVVEWRSAFIIVKPQTVLFLSTFQVSGKPVTRQLTFRGRRNDY